MIKFIEKVGSGKLAFGAVEINQFFEDEDGYLCQKYDDVWFNVLAKPNGDPYSDRVEAQKGTSIRRIINIERIEF